MGSYQWNVKTSISISNTWDSSWGCEAGVKVSYLTGSNQTENLFASVDFSGVGGGSYEKCLHTSTVNIPIGTQVRARFVGKAMNYPYGATDLVSNYNVTTSIKSVGDSYSTYTSSFSGHPDHHYNLVSRSMSPDVPKSTNGGKYTGTLYLDAYEYIATPPSTPSSITVPTTIKGGIGFTVSWGSGSGASSYYLQRSVNGASFTSIYNGSALSKSESPLSTWNTVAYRVRSYNSDGYSSYRTSATRTVINNVAPTTPSSISVPELKSGNNATISWGASTDADGNTINYYLERSVNGGAYSVIRSGGTTRTFDDAILSTWNTVTYRVRGHDGTVYSSYRTSSTVPVTHNTAPTTPSSISVPELKGGSVATISWGASTDADGNTINYYLERSINGQNWTVIMNGDTITSFSDTPQSDWITVVYRVRAFDGTIHSDYVTSTTGTVRHFPELKMRVDGTLKTSVDGWVRVDGVLRKISSMWTRVNGILKQIGSGVAESNNPLDISDCALWLDFSDATTITKSGEFVSNVNDKSGNNNHITQNTSSAQPTSALGSLYFYNGDYMTTNYNIDVSGSDPRTIIVVAKPVSSSSNIYGYGLSSASAMFDGLLSNSVFCIHAYGGGMDNLAVAPSFVANKVQAFTIHYDGQNIISGVNKNYSTPLAMSLNTGNGAMYIGDGIYAGYNTFEGSIMEVIVYKKALNNMELDNIYDYLSNKHYIV